MKIGKEENKMRRGFTLLEIIVVLIIIGIIATLGLTQYTRVIEKGRTAEAKSNLGTIRTMVTAYYQENGSYPLTTYLSDVLGLPTTAPACGNTAYYYGYTLDAAGAGTAARCTSGGKGPNCVAPACTAYSLSLTIAGAGSSSPAGWW